MKQHSRLLKFLFALVACLMCALNAVSQEAYACYTPDNTTLTFYYDTYRNSRTGTTYDLNTESNNPAWYTHGTSGNVTKVVFDPSFADAPNNYLLMVLYHEEPSIHNRIDLLKY